jgi:hypothetical protein
MQRFPPLRSALLSALLAATASLSSAAIAQTATEEAFARAGEAFRQQRYPAAYGLLTRLADQGHGPSARLALLMFDHGSELFGRDWYASPGQQRDWAALAARDVAQRAHRADSAPGE